MPPRSAVWEHFTRFTDDDGKDRARCKRCLAALGAGTRNGTSTLWGHVKICCREGGGGRPESHPPAPPPPPRAPSRSAGSSNYDYFRSFLEEEGGEERGEEEEEASWDLARMIALHGYDPSVVEDDYFRSFLRRVNPGFKLPSRHAVEEMCDGVFDEARKDLFSRLRRASGRVSLAVGQAEAVEGVVVYTACHFIDDDWNLHRVVMDAYDNVPWPLYHGPLSGVPEVALGCRDLSTVAIDRAMDVLASGRERDVLDRVFMVARRKWDKCLHIEPKDHIEQEYPTAHPRRREMIVRDTYMDIELHLIGRSLVAHPDLVRDTIIEHRIESAVQDLHLTRQRRQHLLSHLGLPDLRAYNEHGYSCYCSLQVLRNQEGSSCSIPGIEPELIRMLCSVWGALYRAVGRVSACDAPTSNVCLVELFSVREVLQFEIARAGGDSARVLQDAIDSLDRRIHDSYLVWSVPLVLDPRYKLAYIEFSFRRAFGSKAAAYYISEAATKIRKLYTEYSEHDGSTTDGADSDGAAARAVGSADLLEQAWDEHCRARGEGGMMPPVASSYPEAETELDRYLKDRLAPRTEGFDILNWWKAHSSEYPTVARMARDALAMPTCSQLSSEQLAHVRSILRGYSKEEYKHQVGLTQ